MLGVRYRAVVPLKWQGVGAVFLFIGTTHPCVRPEKGPVQRSWDMLGLRLRQSCDVYHGIQQFAEGFSQGTHNLPMFYRIIDVPSCPCSNNLYKCFDLELGHATCLAWEADSGEIWAVWRMAASPCILCVVFRQPLPRWHTSQLVIVVELQNFAHEFAACRTIQISSGSIEIKCSVTYSRYTCKTICWTIPLDIIQSLFNSHCTLSTTSGVCTMRPVKASVV